MIVQTNCLENSRVSCRASLDQVQDSQVQALELCCICSLNASIRSMLYSKEAWIVCVGLLVRSVKLLRQLSQ